MFQKKRISGHFTFENRPYRHSVNRIHTPQPKNLLKHCKPHLQTMNSTPLNMYSNLSYQVLQQLLQALPSIPRHLTPVSQILLSSIPLC